MTKYLVWRPGKEPEDDGKIIDAYDPNAAACKWAQLSDSENPEYTIAKGDNAVVVVRAVNKPAEQYHMVVSGESVPTYSASAFGCAPPTVKP